MSVQLELIGCKVLAGFVLENINEQTFTVISLATGIEKKIQLFYCLSFSMDFIFSFFA